MPDGRMGMHHPGFPRTPKVFSPEDKKRLAEPPARMGITPQGSFNKNYTADARGGSPFGVGSSPEGGSHGNFDSPGRDRSGPVNRPGAVTGGQGRY
jgi:hypothetical protein